MAGSVYHMWPPYLGQEEYKYRKMTFAVYKPVDYKNIPVIKRLVNQETGEFKTFSDIKGADFTAMIDDIKQTAMTNINTIEKGDLIHSIALPLPNELSDSNSHSWNEESGVMGTVTGGMMTKEVGGVSVSKAIGAFSNTFGSRKILTNPGYFQNYEGTQLRTFDFSFDFMPSNPVEAKEIMEIISIFKTASLPSLHPGGVTMEAPYYFYIDISNEWISNMIKMQGVVIKNVDLTYGEGNLDLFPDGTPKLIRMKLQVAERRMLTQELMGYPPESKRGIANNDD